MADKRNYTGRTITSPGEMRGITLAWQDLHAACSDSPFSDADWINAWAEVFWDDSVDGRVATVWDGDMLVAALPLRLSSAKISKRLPLRTKTLTMLYDDRVGHHDILIRPGHETSARELVRLCLETGARYMDLTPLRPTPGLAAFRAALGGRWRHERVEIVNGLSDLAPGWDGYFAKRSSNTRKGTRKIERKLLDAGARIETLSGDAEGALDALETGFSVSSRSWKAMNGTDIGSQEKNRAFFRGLLRELNTRTRMRLHVLWLNDEAVASCIILFCGETAYGLVTDYDDAHAKSGVGRMLTYHSIRDACHEKLQNFDMLRKTHFTRPFSDTDGDLIRMRVSLRPGLARLIVSGEFAARAFVERYMGDKERKTGRRKIIGERS